jgi:hypothetical protein
MFVVDPPLGSYAPLNRRLLIDAGVARPISSSADAVDFGDTPETLRDSGELQRMSEAGWQRFDIRGFENIASMLRSEH